MFQPPLENVYSEGYYLDLLYWYGDIASQTHRMNRLYAQGRLLIGFFLPRSYEEELVNPLSKLNVIEAYRSRYGKTSSSFHLDEDYVALEVMSYSMPYITTFGPGGLYIGAFLNPVLSAFI
ncbi:unnamed protein product [Gongylonema pulchrum]|uniref:Uncharacterized protein n=1 Tax=Gongylonema pulchrum TaxID=637853 RepID=A0A3P6RBP5_9BILA|nr:unnamed protein product [Gongylonema pulchrum]